MCLEVADKRIGAEVAQTIPQDPPAPAPSRGPGRRRIGLRRFARAEDGTTTVAVLLWLPVFVLVLALVVDAATIYAREARVLQVVQDANRALSVGRIANTSAAENMIKTTVAPIAPNATVSTVIGTDGLITSTVSIPVTDLTVTSLIDAFSGFNVTVSAQMLDEG